MKSKLMTLTIIVSLVIPCIVEAMVGAPPAEKAEGTEQSGDQYVAMLDVILDRGVEPGGPGWDVLVKEIVHKVLREKFKVPGQLDRVNHAIRGALPRHSSESAYWTPGRTVTRDPRREPVSRPWQTTMVLTLPDTDLPKAKAILQEVAKELTVILTDATNQHKERLRKTEAKGLEKRLREADDRLAELALKEQGLFKVGGMVFFDLDGITRRIGELQARMQESRLALESKRARMLAMSRRAAEIAAMAADKVKQDPVAVELKKIVQLQERAREMTHKAAERRSNTTLRLQADKVELGEIEYKRHREKLDKLEELLKEGAASQDQLREQSKKYLEARYALKEAKMLLKFLEEDSRRAPEEELNKQEMKLAQARAELAKHLQAVREKHSGGLLDKLNTELALMEVDTAELKARLKHTEKQLVELTDQRVRVRRDGKRLSLEFKLAERALEEITLERDALRKRIDKVVEPSITALVVEKVEKAHRALTEEEWTPGTGRVRKRLPSDGVTPRRAR